MKVLLTGAFGNVGMSTLQELLRQGHVVRCFDLSTRANRRAAARCAAHEIHWGDIRSPEAVTAAVADQDAVIHLVAIFPPHSEAVPGRAEAVNVGGTKNVLAAIAASPRSPKLVYASSVAVYGHAHHRPPPRTVDEAIEPTDHYTAHKTECERLIRESEQQWAILRLCAIVPVVLAGKDPRLMFREMFAVPPDQRVECVHTHDAGYAFAAAVTSNEVWGKTLLIGGGPTCQMTGREFIGRTLDELGIGRFPDGAYSTDPFHTDWVDTEESQRLLGFQRRSFDDYLAELRASLGVQRSLITLIRPAMRWLVLKQSPYYGGRGESADRSAGA
jgi:UDP-glucose 4-epimerase